MLQPIINFFKHLFFEEKQCKQFNAFVDMHQIHEENVLNRLSTIENKIDVLEKQKAALTAILNKIEQLIEELKDRA